MRINQINSSDGEKKIYIKNKFEKCSYKDEVFSLYEMRRYKVKRNFIMLDEEAKIEKLKKLIEDEEYHVNSTKLAKAMLNGIRKVGVAIK